MKYVYVLSSDYWSANVPNVLAVFSTVEKAVQGAKNWKFDIEGNIKATENDDRSVLVVRTGQSTIELDKALSIGGGGKDVHVFVSAFDLDEEVPEEDLEQ